VKILHTADWHLGVKTMGRDRLQSQKQTVDEICQIAENENVDVVIIAGDVYNTSVPTSLSEELFYQAVERLSNNGDRLVLVLSGNHDDPERLCAGIPLAYKHNIVLAGDLEPLNKDAFVKGKMIEVIDAGVGYVRIKKGNEIANLCYLPFDSTLKARPNIDKKSYSALVGEISKDICSVFEESTYNVFVSHLFLVGSNISRDRVVSVGDVFAVSLNDLPKADYIALGHIHSAQQVGKNAFYSGSTSKISPRKGVLSVKIVENNLHDIDVKTIDLQTPEKFDQITVHSFDEAEQVLKSYRSTDLVEITFVLTEPLKASEIKELKKNYPCLLSVNLELQTEDKNEMYNYSAFTRKNLSDKELFKAFYLKRKGIEPRDSLLEMFLTCKGGKDETN